MASSGRKDDNYSRGYFMSKMWEYQWSGDKLHCVKELLWNAETQSFDTISSSVFFYDYGGNLTNWNSLTFDVEYHYLGDYVFVSYSHNELIYFRGPDNKPRFGIWIIRPEGIDTHPWQFKTK